MRPLLAYASDSDSEFEDELDEQIYLGLNSVDWDALKSICTKLDGPGGPTMYNVVDYNNACQQLGIGPNSLWFSVYRILGQLKLGKPLKWVQILNEFKKHQIVIERVENQFQKLKMVQKSIFLNKWRAESSLNNVLMAKCFAFEVNNLLIPAFTNWKALASVEVALRDDCNNLATEFELFSAFGMVKNVLDQVSDYNLKGTRMDAHNRKVGAINTMKMAVSNTIESSTKFETAFLKQYFSYWRSHATCLSQTQINSRATIKMIFGKVKPLAKQCINDFESAIDIHRYNTSASSLSKLKGCTESIEKAYLNTKTSTTRKSFRQMRSTTNLHLTLTKLKASNQNSQLNSIIEHWRRVTPLQAKAISIHNKRLASDALHIWHLQLKCTLLSDSWHYRRVIQVLKFWYMKCKAEVHLQYKELNCKQAMFDCWRSGEQDRCINSIQVMTRVYEPQWAAAAIEKLRSRLRAIGNDEKTSTELCISNYKQRSLKNFRMVVDHIDEMNLRALDLDRKLTGRQAFLKWKKTADKRRDELLEIKAEKVRADCLQRVQIICLDQWRNSLLYLQGEEEKADNILKRNVFSIFKSLLNENNRKLAQAENVHQTNLKSSVIETFKQFPEFFEEMEHRCKLFQEISRVALEQTIFRRMQIRVVRYKSLEAETVRIADMNIQANRRQLLRHWFSRAVQPQVAEPMTPRSARRLPPTALRRLIQESRNRPDTSGGIAAATPGTPTRVNRQLFSPRSGINSEIRP